MLNNNILISLIFFITFMNITMIYYNYKLISTENMTKIDCKKCKIKPAINTCNTRNIPSTSNKKI